MTGNITERKEDNTMSTYNGWKNYQTWNVALWIGNDEGLYRAAVDFARQCKGRAIYRQFVEHMGLAGTYTADRVKWDGAKLDYRALNDMMRDFR
jgi:hypothetical protein